MKKKETEYLVYLTPSGIIKCRTEIANWRLVPYMRSIEGLTPLSLTFESQTRDILKEILEDVYEWDASPNAIRAITAAIKESADYAPPVRKPTDYGLLGWISTINDSYLVCNNEMDIDGFYLTKGKSYRAEVKEYKRSRQFIRNKVKLIEGSTTSEPHTIQEISTANQITIRDDKGNRIVFKADKDEIVRDRYASYLPLPELDIWKYFERPHVDSVKERYPEKYQQNLDEMDLHEMLSDFTFYPGQRDYVARMACLDSGVIAADTGTGKSLMAIAIAVLKGAQRVCLIAPKGTVKSDDGEEVVYDPAQWVEEFSNFAPELPVFKLFSEQDYNDIMSTHGTLPHGVYISYPEAMFVNGAYEYPKQCKPADRERKFREDMNIPYDPETPPTAEEELNRGLGVSDEGILCLAKPCLSTIIGNVWDMVILDEAHVMCRLSTIKTRSLIRLQPKYRFLLTATPIPNIVTNLFSLMGWVCVANWYKGGRRNARWPFTIKETSRFKKLFVSKENDLTEMLNRQEQGKNPPASKDSPFISRAPTLLRLIGPSVARCSKQDCNPDVVGCDIYDVRVNMNEIQHNAYARNLDLANIDCESPLARAAKQMNILRGICAAPSNYTSLLDNNYNNKTWNILDLMADQLELGEQVIHIAARTAQNDEIEGRLNVAGISTARIDSTVSNHSAQASLFKSKQAQVMLMGIKCAQAYSFSQCSNLIIGSLEWSYGSFQQALGRAYRLNSKKHINCHVVLHRDSIEELLYDKVAQKRDAATLCLHGEPVDVADTEDSRDALANHIAKYDGHNEHYDNEETIEQKWGEQRERLALAAV